ncbi:UbiA prenyltransferase family protein [Palaeococcus ferrophilus]|uniref:UbiA prenyltransferase family protein n=1 Tax=Palaeococcus ferrophilus TaxID=83868 RepID=UPI00064E219C|nr:UbiA family prenyltransferase [Palaeococcus ferrophilus]
MAVISAMIKNTRFLDGRAYMALIGFALLLNVENASPGVEAIAFVAGVLYVLYAFSINNCFDVDTDSVNPQKARKNPVASGELSFRAGVVFSLALIVTGLALSLLINRAAALTYATMALIATLYSAPPRLKARAVLDVLSHGLFFGGLPFLYGALVDASLTREELLIAGAITLYSFALELRNHLEDYESDVRAGLRTTPIAIGRELSEGLVVTFSLGAIGMLLYLQHPLFLMAAPLLAVQRAYRAFDAVVVFLLLIHLMRGLLW